MKVLFLNPLGGLGGGERSLLDVLSALDHVAPKVQKALVTFEDGPLLERARAMGVDARVLALPGELAGLGERAGGLRLARAGIPTALFLRRLRRVIREQSPDVVHTNGIKAHAFACAVSAAPLLLHFRDFLFDRRLSRVALRPLTSFGRKVAVANSLAVARDLERCFPGLPVRSVLNAIDLSEFAPGRGDAALLAELAGLPPPSAGTVHFGLAATYARWKGQDLFLRAAAQLRARCPDGAFRFYVIGGPVYATRGSQFDAAELIQLSRELGLDGALGFVPFQARMAPVYRALDVVVHASTRPEPFGRTVAEAMACGRPVIVAAEGGALELFEPEVSAVGYEPRSALALSRAMERVAASAQFRGQLGHHARVEAESRFALRRLGDELLTTYEMLAG